MGCTHGNSIRIGECKVCLQCGMTILPNGKVFFDKNIVNYKPKEKKKRKGVK